jgi:AraC family transcriptional regulator
MSSLFTRGMTARRRKSDRADFRNPSDVATLIGDKIGGLSLGQARGAVAHIEANLGSKMVLAEISGLAALSKSHFCRAFKHTIGTSPMAYVALRRIERARALIASSSERLSDIALECGFADQPHFNRRFFRVVGMSPGSWRRTVSVSNAG